MSETQVTKRMAEIILEVVNNPQYPKRKAKICNVYHISKRMLTPEKLLKMNGITFFRLMMAIAQEVERIEEYHDMLKKMNDLTLMIAETDDGTSESIINAHKGSIVFQRKLNLMKKNNK